MRALDELEGENESLKRRVTELNAYMTLAYRDALTGLRNRRYLEKRVAEEINRVGRESAQTFSLVLVDIDDFKQINDAHGHAVGDETLRWVAQFLESSVREHDVCCRFAGDEFVVILPQADRHTAELLVERLRQRLDRVQRWSGVSLGLSVGAATFDDDGRTLSALFERADERMYADKRRRKRYASCSAALQGRGGAWSQLVGNLVWDGFRLGRGSLAEH